MIRPNAGTSNFARKACNPYFFVIAAKNSGARFGAVAARNLEDEP
jgi:hypothetical protein